MDALSDVLRVSQLTGGVFLHAEFFAPWCIAARLSPEHCAPVLGPASDLIVYHYVVEGDLRIRVDGEHGAGVPLGAGDVALLPRNDRSFAFPFGPSIWVFHKKPLPLGSGVLRQATTCATVRASVRGAKESKGSRAMEKPPPALEAVPLKSTHAGVSGFEL